MGHEHNDSNNENYLTILKITQDRNEKLVSYIRLTDGAIWGFLALVFVELFKDNLEFITIKIAIFSLILIVSMYLWRKVVRNYQVDIEKGYEKILICEYNLKIPYEVTLRKSLAEKNFPELLSNFHKIKNFSKYDEKISNFNYENFFQERLFHQVLNNLKNGNYVDCNHILLDKFAKTTANIGICVFVISLYFSFFTTNPCVPISFCNSHLCCC